MCYFVTESWITSQWSSEMWAVLSFQRTYFTLHVLLMLFNLKKLAKYIKCMKLVTSLCKGVNKQAS